jgi:hypothetical protein
MRRTRTLRLLLATLAVELPIAACQQRSGGQVELETGAEDAASESTEAERTRLMEEKAAQARSDFEEAKANARTPEEAEAAVREYERARSELNELAEDESFGEDPPN